MITFSSQLLSPDRAGRALAAALSGVRNSLDRSRSISKEFEGAPFAPADQGALPGKLSTISLFDASKYSLVRLADESPDEIGLGAQLCLSRHLIGFVLPKSATGAELAHRRKRSQDRARSKSANDGALD
jgi:hypothetical protein